MVKSIIIGILMPILVFTILLYTCYQYVFNVHGFSFSGDQGNDSMISISIACVLCSVSLLTYTLIMLRQSSSQKISPKNQAPAILSLSNENGDPLYCKKCEAAKPARTHHCKECNTCAPKMDHHCIWINGCVDQDNYKLFFLFVFYIALYALFVEFTLVPILLKEIKAKIGNITLSFCWKVYKIYLASVYHLWKNTFLMIWQRKWIPLFTGVQGLTGLDHISSHWYVVTLLGFLFGLTLGGFAAVHFWYIIRNQTSIEYVADKPVFVRVNFDETENDFEVVKIRNDKTMFDMGLYNNWCSVMGSNPLLWLVPVTETKNLKEYQFNLKFSSYVIDLAKTQRKEKLEQKNQ
ncbi:DHHC palmitoyltransferase-domain-containing protein [Helicostylum pulchrum]|nr:DHHC palmitoyltransferase-domain-containing protein [Helicostylum pulchrum]